MADTLTWLDPALLGTHPDNIRSDIGDLSELAASIKANGVLEPLIVTPDVEQEPDVDGPG